MDKEKISLYKILGIKKNAKKSSIKKAYYRLAKIHYPDKNQGKESKEFHDIKMAYDILMDDEKRKMYDENGFIYTNLIDDKVRANLVALFKEVITRNMNNIKYIDIFLEMINVINEKEKATIQQKEKLKDVKIKLMDIMKRISSKDDENIFDIMIKGEMGMVEQKMEAFNQLIMLGNFMKEKINKYKYKVDKKKDNINDMRRMQISINDIMGGATQTSGSWRSF